MECHERHCTRAPPHHHHHPASVNHAMPTAFVYRFVYLYFFHAFIHSLFHSVVMSFFLSVVLSVFLSFLSFVLSLACFLSFFQGDPFGDVPTVITRPKFPESVQESLKGTNSGMVCQPSCLLMPHYAVAIAIVFLPLRFIVIHCFFSVRYQEHGSRGFVFGQSQSRRCRTEIA